MKIRKAWEALTEAMAKDHDFAWGVQCNIAITIMDRSESSHRDANIAAAEIMQTLFGYDVTGLYNYRDIMTEDLDEELTDIEKKADNPSVDSFKIDKSSNVSKCIHPCSDPTDPNWIRAIKYANPNPILASVIKGMQGTLKERTKEPELTDNTQPSISQVMSNGVGVSKTELGHILPTAGEVHIMRAEINPELVLEDHPELTHSQQLYIKKLIEKVLNFHHPLPFK